MASTGDRLSNTPYAFDLLASAEQEMLTARLLRPRIGEILERLAQLRAQVDAKYAPLAQAAREAPRNKEYAELSLARYPFGFCREIRDEVLAHMLADPFFQELVGRGVTLRSVFIFLRGSYFQNAIQLGNLYLDAANDTAHPEKPKLDWSPIRDLDYENLESWSRFAEVATRYLKVELYPNLHFPLAFPVTPFLAIHGSGSLDLLLAQRIIFHKDCAQGMRRTLALLDERKWMSRRLPEPYEELLRKHCDSNLYTAFPLEYAPCDSNHLRKHVIPEFVTLLRQKPEAVQPTLKSYSELITTAVKTLRAYNLRPAPAVLEQLRADGLIPELSEAPAAVLPES